MSGSAYIVFKLTNFVLLVSSFSTKCGRSLSSFQEIIMGCISTNVRIVYIFISSRLIYPCTLSVLTYLSVPLQPRLSPPRSIYGITMSFHHAASPLLFSGRARGLASLNTPPLPTPSITHSIKIHK